MYICNITLKIDNIKDNIKVFDFIDTYQYLSQLKTLKSIKQFNNNVTFKDIDNNYLNIDFKNNDAFFKEYLNFLKFYFFNNFNDITTDFKTNIEYYKF